MGRYLRGTGRADVASYSDSFQHNLRADEGAEYEKVIEIVSSAGRRSKDVGADPLNLSDLEPHVNGPFTPDLAIPISHLKEQVAQHAWPDRLTASLIGSCTNSSYEVCLAVKDL